jgi:hypothetical protein
LLILVVFSTIKEEWSQGNRIHTSNDILSEKGGALTGSPEKTMTIKQIAAGTVRKQTQP